MNTHLLPYLYLFIGKCERLHLGLLIWRRGFGLKEKINGRNKKYCKVYFSSKYKTFFIVVLLW